MDVLGTSVSEGFEIKNETHKMAFSVSLCNTLYFLSIDRSNMFYLFVFFVVLVCICVMIILELRMVLVKRYKQLNSLIFPSLTIQIL